MNSINTSLTTDANNRWIDPTNVWNGIIYIADTTATPTQRRGIRLINGKVLPTEGVTVASNNPVYIQGDYNTGPSSPPSNDPVNPDPTRPTSSGYTRAPAAVIADAVNILSNSWSDLNAGSVNPLKDRMATPTTVNTAIVAGIVPSSPVGGDGSYSGGAENFPRFHEDWGATKFTYYGSMVELFASQQGIGKWNMTNALGIGVYGAPDRQWFFDNNFKMKPPRGTLMIYSYIKGQWSVL
jgi:hypothetical protein